VLWSTAAPGSRPANAIHPPPAPPSRGRRLELAGVVCPPGCSLLRARAGRETQAWASATNVPAGRPSRSPSPGAPLYARAGQAARASTSPLPPTCNPPPRFPPPGLPYTRAREGPRVPRRRNGVGLSATRGVVCPPGCSLLRARAGRETHAWASPAADVERLRLIHPPCRPLRRTRAFRGEVRVCLRPRGLHQPARAPAVSAGRTAGVLVLS